MLSLSSGQLFIEGIFKCSPATRAGRTTGIFGIKQCKIDPIFLCEPVSVSCGFGGACPRSRGADDLIEEPRVLSRRCCRWTHGEDWTITTVNQGFSVRAKQQTLHPSRPVGSQDNEVSTVSFGESNTMKPAPRQRQRIAGHDRGHQAAIACVIAVAPALQTVALYAADLTTIAPYSTQLTTIAPYSAELTTMAPYSAQLTALSKVPPSALAYLEAHGAAVQKAAAQTAGQWKTWYWICFGGIIFFLLHHPAAARPLEDPLTPGATRKSTRP